MEKSRPGRKEGPGDREGEPRPGLSAESQDWWRAEAGAHSGTRELIGRTEVEEQSGTREREREDRGRGRPQAEGTRRRR